MVGSRRPGRSPASAGSGPPGTALTCLAETPQREKDPSIFVEFVFESSISCILSLPTLLHLTLRHPRPCRTGNAMKQKCVARFQQNRSYVVANSTTHDFVRLDGSVCSCGLRPYLLFTGKRSRWFFHLQVKTGLAELLPGLPPFGSGPQDALRPMLRPARPCLWPVGGIRVTIRFISLQ